MKLFKRSECGFDFIICRFLRIFWDYDCFFIYIELPKHTLRFSPQAGSYIYNKKTGKYLWN